MSDYMLNVFSRQAGLGGKITSLLVSIIILITIESSNAQWISQNTGTTNEIWGMQFLNANTGLIAGANVLKRTTNGGTNWSNVGTPGFNVLREVIIWYGNVWGVTAGHSGAWRTTNEGLNWSNTFATGSYYAMDVNWSNNNLFCAGQAMTYAMTTNWGASWTTGTFSVPGTAGFDIYAVHITGSVTPKPLYICGSSVNNGGVNTPKVCKSTDGGVNFNIILNFPAGVMTGATLNDVEFTGFTGYACSNNGRIFKTTNGTIWDTTYLGNYDLRQFAFKNSNTGFVCGSNGQVFYTSNAGTNWLPYGSTGTASNLRCIEYEYSSGYLWSAGANGTLLRSQVFLDEVNVSGAVSGNGNYLNLTSAFAAINSASQSGADIVIKLNRNITEPTTGAILNQGEWSSLTIKPAAGSAITVSGNIIAGKPLIDLNGSDNVKIDGINSGGSSLTFTNTSTSSASGTSTIRFQNDATNNTITNCNIYGSSLTDFSSPCANILFGGNASSTGNDNNVVSNCDIGPAGLNFPACAVYFSGTTASASLYNSNDTIRNCNVFDYFKANGHSVGIMISSGNTSAAVIDNKLYQTDLRSISSSNSDHHSIQVNNPSGNDFRITGNTIGYSSSAGTGAYSVSGVIATNFYGIYANVGTSSQTIISNNTIAGLQLTGSLYGAYFINVADGLVLVDNNTIGSTSVNNSINFNSGTSNYVQVYGIKLFGLTNSTVSSNKIGGISVTSPLCRFSCIGFSSGGSTVWNCNDNIVGGSVSNSLQCLSAGSGSSMFGISAEGNTQVFQSANNKIKNMRSEVSGLSFNTGTAAMYVSIPSGTFAVSNNEIYSLANTNVSQQTRVSGIAIYAGSGSVSGNLIHSFNLSNTISSMIGINSFAPVCTYYNNMVSLGQDTSGLSVTNGCAVYGVYDWISSASKYYFNSVYIGGNPTVGSSNSYAFYSTSENPRSLMNNIFFNARSNNGSTGKHYAVQVAGTSPNPSGLICNYNDLYASGTGTVLGFFNGADISDLSSWKTATGKDTNSLSSNPKFLGYKNLHVDSAYQSVLNSAGIPVTGITTDFENNTRNVSAPDIGADEFNMNITGQALNFDGTNDGVTLPNSLTQTFTSPGVNELTIEYWFRGTNLQSAVRFQTNSSNYIVAGWGSLSNQKHIISSEGGTGGGVKVGNGIYDGKWHHLAMTWKRNTINGFRSYLDGALVEAKNSSDVALPVLASGGGLGFQAYNSSEYINGSLDEVRIWTRALSQTEIAVNRFHEIDSASGLLAGYHFNQGIAGGNNSGVISLTDLTGSYNGTLVNFSLNGNSSNWLEPGQGFCSQYTEINVQGNGISIADGDAVPSVSDNTDFGSVKADTVCIKTFTIQNSGIDSLDAGAVLITGADSARFTASAITPAGKIAPGVAYSFTITFMPSATGMKNAVVHIPNSDCDEYDYDFAITGTGITAIAQALNFDGINDYVALPVALSQNMTAPSVTELTIEYWFKGSYIQSALRFQTGSNWIVAGWGTPGNEKHLISTEGGTNGISVGAGVSDGNWHHVAMTWKKNSVNGFKSYLDGVLIEQRNSSNTNLPPVSVAGYLGRYNGISEWMNGSLDEVRIWTRELSQSEIAANRFKEINAGAGLLASYHFNQGFAGDDNTGVTALSDAASNNYTGTVTNFTLNGLTSNWIAPGPELIPAINTINITAIPQGFYNASSDMQNLSDTMKVYLCSNASPFNAIDSAVAVIDSISHTGAFTFANASTGSYYLKLVHRNSIQTWSSSPVSFPSASDFDFTASQSQAYGNNMIQVDASPVRFAIFSGDVNQDGVVDASDNGAIDNDAADFEAGYRSTDLNGDDIIDASDAAIADNNAANFVSAITP